MKFVDILSSPLKRQTTYRELPPYADTGWRVPQYFPELRDAILIAFDCETKETDFDHGPGWARGEGWIIGVSVAALWADGRTWKGYYPVRHEVESEYNVEAGRVFNWLREQLHTPNIPKTGANLLYDVGWLTTENIYVEGWLYDVQFAEALIDEIGPTALDFLGRKYLRQGKTADACKEWVYKAYGNAVNEDNWRGFLWRTPPRLVGPYAEDDADLPLRILPAQWSIMETEGTLALFHMECKQIPMLVRMRAQGVPVDVGRAETMRAEIITETAELYGQIKHKYGVAVDNVNEKDQLIKLFNATGIEYPKTAKGAPSIRKEWLNGLDKEQGVGKLINDIREREKLVGTFLDKYVLGRAKLDSDSNSRGRIFCSFHPLRNDDNGAKTGRYSSSDPNLQNIPARSAIGKKIRYIFIPEYGHCGWHKKDHSQIEYRVFAHYAVGARSDEIRYRYCEDPTTDYHDDTMRDVARLRNIVLEAMSKDERDRFRKPIKNVNFGLLYGQTENSLAYKAGWTTEQASEFFTSYHGARPFVRSTMQAIESEVQAFGYITDVMGRRCRFNRWEALKYDDRKKGAFDYETAVRLFGGAIRRAWAYRGVNYRFQGSAASILKKGMLDCYESGVYDYVGFPKITVHDELGWSRIDNSPAQNEAYAFIAHKMETAIQLRVPLKVDSSDGATWGDCA
jgi:DNA polymerase I-like protein with 3'-5' exonuclease and polymerase domains